MISATNIWVKYGDRVLLDNINVIIGDRDRVGLVGKNGAGKSTLLKIIANDITPDKGNVQRPTLSTLGFLHQELNTPMGKTVIEETLTAFARVKQMERRLTEINVELGERTDYESEYYTKLIEELSETNEQFALLGGLTMRADAERILSGLGFLSKDLDRLTDEFSGGWQMRIELAKILLSKPDFMLLDEPTNHLDIESIVWLEGFLSSYEGAVVVISHDKTFLDKVTNRTVEIELGQVHDYKAAYSKYLELRIERREKLASSFKNQQKQIAQTERLIERFRTKASKAKMAQSLIKQLDKMDRIEVDNEDVSTMRINFPPAPRSGEVVVEVKDVLKEYGDIRVLDHVDFKITRGEKVAFVGKNGEGKTTLSKIIVNTEAATSGIVKLGHQVKIGYYAQQQAEELDPKLNLLESMEQGCPDEMRTKLRSILGAFMFSGEDAEKKVSVLSGGERARLALAKLLLHPINLLVLDEPTNHLDILSKEVLKQAIDRFDGTMIVVSHDRDFLQSMTDRTIEFRDQKLHEYLGDVKFFLEKRNVDNFRQVSLGEKVDSPVSLKTQAPVNTAKQLSKEERKALDRDKKKLQRAAQSIERKLKSLKKQVKDYEQQMSKPDFYQGPNANDILAKYNQAKADAAATMESWEEAEMEYELFLEEHGLS